MNLGKYIIIIKYDIIPEKKGIQNFNDYIKNLNNLSQPHQAKDIYNSIVINNSFFHKLLYMQLFIKLVIQENMNFQLIL